MRITSADISAGRVESRIIENGCVVPPSLQVNASTLAEHQARLAREGRRLLTRLEAESLHGVEQAGEWFG